MTLLTAGCAVAALMTVTVAGCGGGDDYCEAVEDRQSELTEITASGAPVALLDALPVFRDLAESAPDDLRDEWRTLLGPLEELDDALRAAGVDPSAYEPGGLPDSLTAADRERIESAALALAAPSVAGAFDGIQQQAKDVCHTPLTL